MARGNDWRNLDDSGRVGNERICWRLGERVVMGFFQTSGILNSGGFFGNFFNPRNINSLQLWLDASDGETLYDSTSGGNIVTNNGSSVKRWEDKSGNGRHATQNTTPPTLSTNSQNNKSSIQFNGTTSKLDIGTFSISGDISIFIIMARAWQNNAYAAILSSSNYTTTAGFAVYASTSNASNNWQSKETLLFGNGYLSSQKPQVIGPSGTLTNNQFYLIYYSAGNAEAKILINNADITRFASTSSIPTTNTTWKIGEALGSYFDGKCAEIIFYNKKLQQDEIISVTNYLNTKYAIY